MPGFDTTNGDRAGAAEQALLAFAQERGLIRAGEAMETALGDLLGDLRHLARMSGVDFEKLVSRSEMNADAEASGEDGDEEGEFSPSSLWPAVKED